MEEANETLELNRDALAEFITNIKNSEEEFSPETLTDEAIQSFFAAREAEKEEVEETEKEVEEEVEDDIDLEDIDRESLDEKGQKLYDMLMEQKTKYERKEVELVINGAALNPKLTKALEKMADLGASVEEIEAAVADFKELAQSTTRKKGTGTKVATFSKSAVKAGESKKKNESPKFGTKAFGAMLASKK